MINEKGKSKAATMKKVLYAPDLHGNFISIKKVLKNNFKVLFESDKCKLYYNNEHITTATLVNDLFILNSEKVLAVTSNKKCIHYWHRIQHFSF